MKNKKIFRSFIASLGLLGLLSTSAEAEPEKISLTIGFANFAGEDLAPLVAEDAKVLSPLFKQSIVVPSNQIPRSEILFIYARLNEDGTIQGLNNAGVRQIVKLTKAAIVVIASPNSVENIKKAAALPGPKTANIVFTLDRNGQSFNRFFAELFKKMSDGKSMFSAWVELAPQGPAGNTINNPATILISEGGNIGFPH